MSVVNQSKDPGSPLRRYLDQWLPGRTAIIERWRRALADTPWSPWNDAYDRSLLGKALEVRIGLDLANEPASWPVLASCPPARCTNLLRAVGFEVADLSQLPESGTTDPLLRAWTRVRHPLHADDDEQLGALYEVLDLVHTDSVAHHLGSRHSVELRRAMGLFMHRQEGTEVPVVDRQDPDLIAFTHLWSGYLNFGRQALFGLGERVVLSPGLARGFATADLVVGSTLVELKASADPAEYLDAWLDQLLGYLLCDRLNVLGIQEIAVYCGWQGILLTASLDEVMQCVAGIPRPDLTGLRNNFRTQMADDMDASECRYLRTHGLAAHGR